MAEFERRWIYVIGRYMKRKRSRKGVSGLSFFGKVGGSETLI